MGWLTVASYLLASLLAALVFRRRRERQRAFWFYIAIILAALAVNKQLDLQSALTVAGRCAAQAQGWYGERRSVQFIFILAIIGASMVAALSLFWVMRRDLAEIWLALIGFVFLLSFIAVRAAGFHHFDQFIGHEISGVRMNWVMEIGGVAMIAANGLHLLLRQTKDHELSELRKM